MAPRRPIKAWVVRWQWAGAHAAVEQPIAAILPPRTSGDSLLRIVDALYAVRFYDPDEMLSSIRRGGHNPYPAQWARVRVEIDGEAQLVQWSGEVICGHNPHLVARKAQVWALNDGSGQVGWEDVLRPNHR
jgi:hypothetical protein